MLLEQELDIPLLQRGKNSIEYFSTRHESSGTKSMA
jgi:hypothetical protein